MPTPRSPRQRSDRGEEGSSTREARHRVAQRLPAEGRGTPEPNGRPVKVAERGRLQARDYLRRTGSRLRSELTLRRLSARANPKVGVSRRRGRPSPPVPAMEGNGSDLHAYVVPRR